MRLIDADALIEEIAKIADLRTLSTKTIGKAIDRVPTAEIIRCKDCKHMIINKHHENKPMICCLTKMCGTTDADWFCADGERKEQ